MPPGVPSGTNLRLRDIAILRPEASSMAVAPRPTSLLKGLTGSCAKQPGSIRALLTHIRTTYGPKSIVLPHENSPPEATSKWYESIRTILSSRAIDRLVEDTPAAHNFLCFAIHGIATCMAVVSRVLVDGETVL
jgi:hypothetical protein